MTIVTIQVGQCGNQLGVQFFNSLGEQISTNACSSTDNSDFAQNIRDRFFCHESENHVTARAILIDTEPKVVERAQLTAKKRGIWSYRKGRSYVRRQGAGNNWAQGYHRHGEEGLHAIGDIIAGEVESCDWLSGFLVLSSCAGGTGSGLGSRVLELLREQYPSVCTLSQMVWPFSSGEVTVQSYNSVLTLAHCHRSVDGLLLQQNDRLYKTSAKLNQGKTIDLEQMNDLATQQLVGLLLPSFDAKWKERNFADLLVQLAPSPVYKLMQLFASPQESPESSVYSSHIWPALLKDLLRQTVETEESIPVQFSSLLTLRGQGSNKADADALKTRLRYSPHLPETQSFDVFHHPNSVLHKDKLAVFASNGPGLVPLIDRATDRAWSMFCAKAYLHHYARYGLSQDDFHHSFETVEKIIGSYKDLSGANS